MEPIVSQEINPYAVVESGRQLPPIFFYGRLTNKEFLQGHRKTGIQTSARIMGWFWVLGLTIFSFLYIAEGWVNQTGVIPGIWFLLGITYFFAIWLPLFQKVADWFGAAGKKMRRGLDDQSATF